MTRRNTGEFLAGVIEGFYGQPWSMAERVELVGWMSMWGLNTYLYAPKDDLKHRILWREPYSQTEATELKQMIGHCRERSVRFIYALSPGLDIRYASPSDLALLQKRFEQLLTLGCEHFALLFDDIPDRLDAEDIQRWGSLASAQCHVANSLFHRTRARAPEGRFLFCPTPYCGRMARGGFGGAGYLSTIGAELLPEIDVLWTGPEIISQEITVSHVRELRKVLRRKPLIWDNLFANDYDGRRFFCGPYSGRPQALRNWVAGLLINPNNELPLNYVPLRTLGEFVRCKGRWMPRKAYLSAMRGWLRRFDVAGQPVSLEDLILFGDCYYLPHEDGPDAALLCNLAANVLGGDLQRWREQAAVFRERVVRLREFCVRMALLRERPLFHALSRRIWELREELDLLERWVAFKSQAEGTTARFSSDFHLPGTYRGGIVARLQNLLMQLPDGTFLTRVEMERAGRPVRAARGHER